MTNTTGATQRLTYEEAIQRARALAPAIRERGRESEVQRKQLDETIQEIKESGLIRQLQPARFGGHELPIRSLVDTTIEIARADPSAGWCFTLLGLHAFMLAGWPEQAQRDIWEKDQDALIASAFGPVGKISRVDGGYMLSGRWSYSSGIDHSEWAMVGAMELPAKPGELPKHLMMLVPRTDFQIEDDWNVSGIRASGSKTIVIPQEVFVPEHRVVDLVEWSKFGRSPGSAVNKGHIYQLPIMATIGFFLCSAVLGAAKGAYDLWMEACRQKVTQYTRRNVTTFSHQQIRMAELEADLTCADLLLHHAVDRLDTVGLPDREAKVRGARDFSYAAKLSASVVQRLFANSGAGSIYEHNPMQRFWRDVQVMSMHAALNFDFNGEMFGRLAMGVELDPDNLYY
jgi:3-hydroxy-9,10-secoandrosta-1,3,5(10)-triene-9,17-dione monooxygenase